MSDNILEQLKELIEGIYFSLNEGKNSRAKRRNLLRKMGREVSPEGGALSPKTPGARDNQYDIQHQRGKEANASPIPNVKAWIDRKNRREAAALMKKFPNSSDVIKNMHRNSVRSGENGTNPVSGNKRGPGNIFQRNDSSTTLKRLGQTLIENLSNLFSKSSTKPNGKHGKGADPKGAKEREEARDQVAGEKGLTPEDRQVIHQVRRNNKGPKGRREDRAVNRYWNEGKPVVPGW